MNDIGIVRGVRIGKSFRSERDVVLLSVEIDDPRDIQTVEYLFPHGECGLPNEGDSVVITEISEEYKVATASNTGVVVSTLSNGEKSIFAVKDGAATSIITLLNSGEIVLNEGTDYAVQFTALKTGFDLLRNQLNSFINKYNLHIHTGVIDIDTLTCETIVTTSQAVLASAKIDSSKVEKVRI